jgi:hypothetical protein
MRLTIRTLLQKLAGKLKFEHSDQYETMFKVKLLLDVCVLKEIKLNFEF